MAKNKAKPTPDQGSVSKTAKVVVAPEPQEKTAPEENPQNSAPNETEGSEATTPELQENPEGQETPDNTPDETPDENASADETPNEPDVQDKTSLSEKLNNPQARKVTSTNPLQRPKELKTKEDFAIDGMITALENFNSVPFTDDVEMSRQYRKIFAPVRHLIENPTVPVLSLFLKVLRTSTMTSRQLAEVNRAMTRLSYADSQRFVFVMSVLKSIVLGSVKSSKDFDREQFINALGPKYKKNGEALVLAIKQHFNE